MCNLCISIVGRFMYCSTIELHVPAFKNSLWNWVGGVVESRWEGKINWTNGRKIHGCSAIIECILQSLLKAVKHWELCCACDLYIGYGQRSSCVRKWDLVTLEFGERGSVCGRKNDREIERERIQFCHVYYIGYYTLYNNLFNNLLLLICIVVFLVNNTYLFHSYFYFTFLV